MEHVTCDETGPRGHQTGQIGWIRERRTSIQACTHRHMYIHIHTRVHTHTHRPFIDALCLAKGGPCCTRHPHTLAPSQIHQLQLGPESLQLLLLQLLPEVAFSWQHCCRGLRKAGCRGEKTDFPSKRGVVNRTWYSACRRLGWSRGTRCNNLHREVRAAIHSSNRCVNEK